MKTLYLFSSSFPPKSGGVAKAGMDLTEMFESFGYRVVVFAKRTNDDHDAENQTGDRLVFRISENDSKVICDCILNAPPDIMLLNGWNTNVFRDKFRYWMTEKCIEVSRETKCPLIYRSHGSNTAFELFPSPPFYGLPTLLLAFVGTFRWICRSRSFAQSVFLSPICGLTKNFDRFAARLLGLKNISDIPNTFPSVRNNGCAFRKPDNATQFVCIAGASERKGQVDAIRCLRELTRQDVSFVFISPTKNEYAISMEKEAQGDSRFVFKYDLPRADVVTAINQADCVFLYAKHEQQPLILLEAMSCAKPWICTNTGSVAEMKGGIILKKRNARCLSDAVERMCDVSLRNKLGAEGEADWGQNYSPEVVYAKWRALLKKLGQIM